MDTNPGEESAVTKLRAVEYCLLRYVPNVTGDEGVSIAAIVIDPSNLEQGLCTMSIATDWKTRVQVLDPHSDLEMLGALLTEVRERLLSGRERCGMLHQLEDSFSNVVQVSQTRKRVVALSPETIDDFARGLLERTPMTSPGLSGMRDAACQETL
jgi:hypothetical protein